MFAIRVARQLELPSEENVPLLNAMGRPGTEKAMENKGVTGNYRSSEGVTGDAVWSTRAKWMDLYGEINNEKVSVVICDRPSKESLISNILACKRLWIILRKSAWRERFHQWKRGC